MNIFYILACVICLLTNLVRFLSACLSVSNNNTSIVNLIIAFIETMAFITIIYNFA